MSTEMKKGIMELGKVAVKHFTRSFYLVGGSYVKIINKLHGPYIYYEVGIESIKWGGWVFSYQMGI